MTITQQNITQVILQNQDLYAFLKPITKKVRVEVLHRNSLTLAELQDGVASAERHICGHIKGYDASSLHYHSMASVIESERIFCNDRVTKALMNAGSPQHQLLLIAISLQNRNWVENASAIGIMELATMLLYGHDSLFSDLVSSFCNDESLIAFNHIALEWIKSTDVHSLSTQWKHPLALEPKLRLSDDTFAKLFAKSWMDKGAITRGLHRQQCEIHKILCTLWYHLQSSHLDPKNGVGNVSFRPKIDFTKVLLRAMDMILIMTIAQQQQLDAQSMTGNDLKLYLKRSKIHSKAELCRKFAETKGFNHPILKEENLFEREGARQELVLLFAQHVDARFDAFSKEILKRVKPYFLQ